MNKSVRLEGFTTSKDDKTSIVAFVMSVAISMWQKVGGDNSKISGSLLRFSAQNLRLYTVLFGFFGPFSTCFLNILFLDQKKSYNLLGGFISL